ncbi:MAG: hypothetical protein IIC67_01785 [Thaumarchaeota archaeon]|nr:hypothetical protein [Nitrososphaerota archaeon]
MMDKALMIIIFMYIAGFSIVGIQFTLADVFNITLTNMEGLPIRSHIVDMIREGNINERTGNIVTANFTTNSTFYDRVETSATSMAYVTWELITLLTGTQIFYLMFLFGMDKIFVGIFVVVYVLLLARAIIGYLRGV